MDTKSQQKGLEEKIIKIVNKIIESNYKNMDDLNKKATTVMKEEGMEAAVKHMFTGENEQQLSYAEMRARYG
jgi:hypothetical protein